jgi:hypothetical protein
MTITGNHKLLILGSLCAHPEDRALSRKELRTAQLFENGNFYPIEYFNNWGDLGISSLDWEKTKPEMLWITLGNNLVSLNIESGELINYPLKNIKDVHEITVIKNSLWLSNTSEDEIIEFDLEKKEIKNRIKLSNFKPKAKLSNTAGINTGSVIVDKYHCNQVFEGYDENIYALTHHVEGKQLIKQIAQKLIKSHGDGGVVNISVGNLQHLKLKAPHNVRKINNEYWVCSSGHFTINVYDKNWNFKNSFATKGWGRGVDVADDKVYVGISETRKRYKSLSPSESQVKNMIQVFSAKTYELLEEFNVPFVEQLNNIYALSDKQYTALKNLSTVTSRSYSTL